MDDDPSSTAPPLWQSTIWQNLLRGWPFGMEWSHIGSLVTS